MTTDKCHIPATAPMWWDGGDRAITAREKATIEEHGPSCFTIPLVPAIPAVRCGGCGDAIQPDAMLGTRCRCACSTEHQAGEVQGDARAALEAAMPYVETLHSIVGGEARASVWRCIERGRAALAATGSQQVGEESAGLPEMCRSCTNAQGIQVGEVPGDALVPVQPRALAASIAELEALMEGECLDPLTTSESESVMLVLQELKRLQLVAARHPVAQVPVEMTAEFTDTGRAAIAWVLWHHQGGSSPVGQPLRFALGMGQHDRMTDQQIAEAKRFAAWAGATTESFHRRSPAQGIDLGQVRVLLQGAAMFYDRGLKGRCRGRIDDALALIDQRDAAPGVDRG
ncbi:hypothetical protein [Stenotrophomonas nematodicola]|uniref:hypothetical protein n=1 Tax=Stenotrophomonas nematodicola TaxID=2656746 RepID=UPI003D9A205E